MTGKRILQNTFIAAAIAFAGVPAVFADDKTEEIDVQEIKAEYVRPFGIPFPEDNPYTEKKYELGHQLFFDPRISGSGAISCATCHNPGLGWEDGLDLGVGHHGAKLGRHTPTILNLAWGMFFFWDGRAATLEDQALGPIESAVEMNMSHGDAIVRLNEINAYVKGFEEVFPEDGLTIENVGKAIATFERTIVSAEAPFDRWINGAEDAISESAKRGFVTFNTKANCAICHAGWRFTDDGFHDIGVDSDDIGRAEILPIPALQHAFKTPTLRNVEERSPYLHDGSEETLMDVVNFYNDGFVKRESLSSTIKPLGLTEEEKTDLVEFMKTLTSEDEQIQVPNLPK